MSRKTQIGQDGLMRPDTPEPSGQAGVSVQRPDRDPRLVATDLDGTLLDPAGQVTPRTKRAFEHVWACGVETVLVTARPPRWVDELAELVGGNGIVICANGALWYDVAAGAVIHSDAMTVEYTIGLANLIRDELPGVLFAVELATGVHYEPGYPELHPATIPPDAVWAPLNTVHQPVGKLLARHLAMPETEFLDRVTAIVGDRAEVIYSGAGGLAEIGPVGVSKAGALALLAAEHGIAPDEVWAFGDMPNDLPMLTWAGTSFAVANAHPDVLAAATFICPTNADDGVAQVLETIRAGSSWPDPQSMRP